MFKRVNEFFKFLERQIPQVAGEHAETEVGPAVTDAMHLMMPLAARKDVSLGITGPEVDCKLMISEQILRQILLNILSNAIKFTKAGDIVRLSVKSQANGDLAIRIHDTGVGMSKDDIMVALAPFGQVTNQFPDHCQEQGAGLGLPLVKAMMDSQHGALHIDSLPGDGTIVNLMFPASRVVRAQPLRCANTH